MRLAIRALTNASVMKLNDASFNALYDLARIALKTLVLRCWCVRTLNPNP